jgi:hypothetical protein
MDRLREEAQRLLETSGYKGMIHLHSYLKAFKQLAYQEGFTPENVELAINEIVEEYFK